MIYMSISPALWYAIYPESQAKCRRVLVPSTRMTAMALAVVAVIPLSVESAAAASGEEALKQTTGIYRGGTWRRARWATICYLHFIVIASTRLAVYRSALWPWDRGRGTWHIANTVLYRQTNRYRPVAYSDLCVREHVVFVSHPVAILVRSVLIGWRAAKTELGWCF